MKYGDNANNCLEHFFFVPPSGLVAYMKQKQKICGWVVRYLNFRILSIKDRMGFVLFKQLSFIKE